MVHKDPMDNHKRGGEPLPPSGARPRGGGLAGERLVCHGARKPVDCLLWVGESLAQIKEFKYPGVLFVNEGTIHECEIGRRIGAAGAVLHCIALYCTAVTKKRAEPQGKALDCYRSIFVPILTEGHEGWVMTDRTRSRVQAAGFSLRDRVRSLVIHEELGLEPLLRCLERSQWRWFIW